MPRPRTCDCGICRKCICREQYRARYRAKAYGTWHPRGDMAKVQQHLADLRKQGTGLRRIAEAADTSRRHLQRICDGSLAFIGSDMAERILAVQPHPPHRVPMLHVSRRLQALAAIGYSAAHLARLLDRSPDLVAGWMAGARYPTVERRTLELVSDLYERLCMTPGPSPLARAAARRQGYAPPLAWDDIDDPDEHPAHVGEYVAVDPVVVARILSGDWRLRCTPDEKRAVCERWLDAGRPLAELERRTGWRCNRYVHVGDRQEAS